MIIKRIAGTTRTLGKSQGYLGLPIRDVSWIGGAPAMQSAWEPSPDEIAAINKGAPVILSVIGSGHPPVMITVGEVPE